MTAIADLMGRDPLKLTKDDRAQIVAHFRENRAKFLLGQKQAPVAPKEKKEKPAGGLKPSLSDLFD